MHDIRPYSGVKILDLTHHYGAYAGRLFANLGAQVTYVPTPSVEAGSNAMDYAALFTSLGKTRFKGDTGTPDGLSALMAMSADADIILLEREGPLYDRWSDLVASNPRAVVTLVSPFGTQGPWAERKATDLTLQAAGGIAWLSGRIDDAPLRLPFDQSVYITSVYAAVATAIAFWDSEASGSGHVVDLSVQECIAHSLQNAIQVYDLENRISQRGGEGTRDCSEDMFPCADGFVFMVVSPMVGSMWSTFIEWVSEFDANTAQAFSDPKWRDRTWRTTSAAKAEFRSLVEPVLRNKTRIDLRTVAIARRLIIAPVYTIKDLFEDDQMAVSRFFVEVPDPVHGRTLRVPGAPYRLSEPVWDAGKVA